MKEPLVSVVMSVYNSKKYLRQAIDSILQQTFNNFEFIIINDGSTDNSLELIKSNTDDRIILINQENQGIAVSLNNGIKIAKGKYIARMDADDISHKNRLKTQTNFLNENPDVIVVGSNADVIDKDGDFVYLTKNALDNNTLKKSLPLSTPFIHPSVMFRREIFFKAGMYPNIPIAQDVLLFSKMVTYGSFANLHDPLIKYRISPSSSSRRSKETRNRLKQTILYYNKYHKLEQNHVNKLNESLHDINDNQKKYYYYTLLAKKYLWNNYQPKLARKNIKKSLKYNPLYLLNLWMYFLSFLSGKTIRRLYLYFK